MSLEKNRRNSDLVADGQEVAQTDGSPLHAPADREHYIQTSRAFGGLSSLMCDTWMEKKPRHFHDESFTFNCIIEEVYLKKRKPQLSYLPSTGNVGDRCSP